MTQVVIVQYGEGTYHISIHGHAEYAKHGADVVCAACSQLTYTLSQALRSMNTDGELTEYHENISDDGSAVIIAKVRNRERFLIWADAVIDTIVGGFRLLQDKYPENVSVDIDRVQLEP